MKMQIWVVKHPWIKSLIQFSDVANSLLTRAVTDNAMASCVCVCFQSGVTVWHCVMSCNKQERIETPAICRSLSPFHNKCVLSQFNNAPLFGLTESRVAFQQISVKVMKTGTALITIISLHHCIFHSTGRERFFFFILGCKKHVFHEQVQMDFRHICTGKLTVHLVIFSTAEMTGSSNPFWTSLWISTDLVCLLSDLLPRDFPNPDFKCD